jgi:hypothetical protein
VAVLAKLHAVGFEIGDAAFAWVLGNSFEKYLKKT